MLTSILVVPQLFSSAFCAESFETEICATKKFRNSGYKDRRQFIHKHPHFSIQQVRIIESQSSVCALLSREDLEELMNIYAISDSLIQKLPFNCIKDIATQSPENFDILFDQISHENERVNSWMVKHADNICAHRKIFAGTSFEDDAKKFCRHREISKSEEKRKLIANETEILKNQINGASAQKDLTSTISIMAAFLVITFL